MGVGGESLSMEFQAWVSLGGDSERRGGQEPSRVEAQVSALGPGVHAERTVWPQAYQKPSVSKSLWRESLRV